MPTSAGHTRASLIGETSPLRSKPISTRLNFARLPRPSFVFVAKEGAASFPQPASPSLPKSRPFFCTSNIYFRPPSLSILNHLRIFPQPPPPHCDIQPLLRFSTQPKWDDATTSHPQLRASGNRDPKAGSRFLCDPLCRLPHPSFAFVAKEGGAFAADRAVFHSPHPHPSQIPPFFCTPKVYFRPRRLNTFRHLQSFPQDQTLPL